jgi:hypothetical protein
MPRHREDRRDDGVVVRVADQIADEAAIVLRLSRAVASGNRAGVAHAEVIDGNPHAQAADRLMTASLPER